MCRDVKRIEILFVNVYKNVSSTEIQNLIMTKPVKTLGLRPLWLIRKYSQPCTRVDWRKGSSINAILTRDQWWEDYIFSWGNLHNDESWHDWCVDKLIIGPPGYRSGRELAELDEDYLDGRGFIRHYVTWMKTWPDPDDHSWCTGPYRTTLPDWVIAEYIASHTA